MKSYFLTVVTLYLLTTGFNFSVNAGDKFNHDRNELKSSSSLSIDLAQNSADNPQTAKEYFDRGVI